ncbi:MAG: FAD-dependent oxidoreductase [Planctomycetota bacterium]
MRESKTDILIIGGGLGGCAAAMAAAELSYRVILTEETDWLGGQVTSQAVPCDEHAQIEEHGCTARYRRFRNGVRQYYRDHYPLLPEAKADPRLNPGKGNVSRISCEPRVALAVLDQMTAYPRMTGRLQVRLRRKPIAAETDGDRISAVHVRNLETGDTEVLTAPFILDATELGDLLSLAGVEYVVGAEAQSETGEPHAAAEADPNNVQCLTWCLAMAYDPDGNHVIAKPGQYDFWHDDRPALRPKPWPGPMLSWTYCHPMILDPRTACLFPEPGKPSFWLYRRIVCKDHYPADAAPHEATILNWPQNDYFKTSIIDQPEDVTARALDEARQLTLSLLYWLQTEAPRPDGGAGYPGLYPRPDMTGAADGLAKYPYIRESRRIKAAFTITENHVGKEARAAVGKTAAEQFDDSVGVGYYHIDLHPSTGGDNYIDFASLPFQIPLGALLPVCAENLLPACKNIGATHVTNGCYRLHPVEWGIGEAAGILAAFCLQRKAAPRQVREKAELLRDFQSLLRAQGVELEWPRT